MPTSLETAGQLQPASVQDAGADAGYGLLVQQGPHRATGGKCSHRFLGPANKVSEALLLHHVRLIHLEKMLLRHCKNQPCTSGLEKGEYELPVQAEQAADF